MDEQDRYFSSAVSSTAWGGGGGGGGGGVALAGQVEVHMTTSLYIMYTYSQLFLIHDLDSYLKREGGGIEGERER